MQEKIETELLRLCHRAIKRKEVPVAAIVVCRDKIISKSYNRVNKYNNVLKHAEIDSLVKAARKLNNWRLNDCILYVTLEPCDMCKQVIKKFRLKKVVYFTKQNNYSIEKNIKFIQKNNEKFDNLLKNFFRNKKK